MASTAYAKALESASFPKFVSTTVQLDSAQDLTLTLCPGLSTKLKQSNTYDTPRDPQREAVAIREAMAKATGEPPVSMRASVTRVWPVLAQPSGCAASSSRGVGRDATPSQVEYVVMQHELGRDQGGTDRRFSDQHIRMSSGRSGYPPPLRGATAAARRHATAAAAPRRPPKSWPIRGGMLVPAPRRGPL